MRTFLRILLIIALIGNCAWFLHEPGYEQAISIINAIAALITLVVDSNTNTGIPKYEKMFTQNNSSKATGYQAENMTFNHHNAKSQDS
ncbi:hypothetical protein [Hymenobacter sp. BT559]|uniref:hypothetical protein n=1 Tax=Hymenobacter sp. BT559 TaxID=2795729 RepID=UPI0018ED839A|nr:hypothetical protein [Hymenobacter sp. BT559]MBJ6141769.1 hypothetical protein [Hymenobacter sp. BT559]